MSDPERVYVYTATEWPCPLCGEPFTVRLEVGAIEGSKRSGLARKNSGKRSLTGWPRGASPASAVWRRSRTDEADAAPHLAAADGNSATAAGGRPPCASERQRERQSNERGGEAVSGLSHGKGRTERPPVYAGCLPCGQGRWVADLEHANIWLSVHWNRCRSFGSGLRGAESVSAVTERATA